MAKLGKVTFFGCTQVRIWALDIQERTCAKKVGLELLKKIDWTYINEPMAKKLICSFNYDN
jgi:hypothetical protein